MPGATDCNMAESDQFSFADYDLSPKQIRVLEYIAEGQWFTVAADKAEVRRETVWRWRVHSREFQRCYRDIVEEQGKTQLAAWSQAAILAVNMLVECMLNDELADKDRIAAAREICANERHWRSLKDMPVIPKEVLEMARDMARKSEE